MERIVEFDLVRATEVLAQNTDPGLGRGDDLSKNNIRLRAPQAEGQL